MIVHAATYPGDVSLDLVEGNEHVGRQWHGMPVQLAGLAHRRLKSTTQCFNTLLKHATLKHER